LFPSTEHFCSNLIFKLLLLNNLISFHYLTDGTVASRQGTALNWVVKLPFDLVYPRAFTIENFWRQEDIDYLPYRLLLIYQEDRNDTRSVLWRCNLCGFWCTVLDQRLMERHLCMMCPLLSDFDRLQLRTYVLEQALRQIEDILE